MKQQKISSLNKWIYANLDLTEQILESYNKAIILVAGASSSGKSYASESLNQIFEQNNKKCVVISTDSYNKGVSGIIFDKVNEKLGNTISPRDEIVSIIKDIIYHTDFENKFCKENLNQIKKQCSKYIPKPSMNLFLELLSDEFSKINFDEQSVYDLNAVSQDINKLCLNQPIKKRQYSKVISEQIETQEYINGNDIDVIIIEGIYALSQTLTNRLNFSQVITNFVESDPKTLFLRRVLRDNKQTSASSIFTISNYFKHIMPSYIETILPTKQNANLVFENNLTFAELRSGEKAEVKEKIQIRDYKFIKQLLENSTISSTSYHKDIYYCSKQEFVNKNNLLRLRMISTNGKDYEPSSLVHKGEIKLRTDNKIIRPINLLIKEGDFFKIFNNFNDFDINMKNAGFKQERIVEKKRIRIKYLNQDLVIDDIKNEGVFIEFSNNNPEFINFLKIQINNNFINKHEQINLSKD